MTYLPRERLLRFAYAGHPPAVRMSDGGELVAPSQGIPLGVHAEPEYIEGTLQPTEPTGVLLYTDGLTEARHNGSFFGLAGVAAVLGKLENGSASEAVTALRARVAEFADDSALTDDLCILAAHIG
jgi:sigma-B regulation protein RsbU (phosphoserine phosphatase)